ncbi:hypothetical protein KBI52_18105 [Microvirga sp. HBU67558]|nr:hypothetical protein [Microvirga sp. HBU67558]MBQ0822107.1 hypothetical protein [Microvirga sp. HBU67558]
MRPSEFTARPREAAQIAGWKGAAGLQTQLKQGLLQGVGLPDDPSAEIPANHAKRWTWSNFTFTDICGFRLAKVLMDAGVDAETAREIVSAQQVWEYQYQAQQIDEGTIEPCGDAGADHFVVVAAHKESVWAGERYAVLSTGRLIEEFSIRKRGPFASLALTVISLSDVRRDVIRRIETLKTETAED